MGFRVLVALLLLSFSFLASAEELELRYEGFRVWLDCEKRAAVRFHYYLQRDTGNIKRQNRFNLDPNLSKDCQQTSTDGYNRNPNLDDSHRGHLVPYNHMDHSKRAASQTNYMSNILPQAGKMNTGAWYLTEEIAECFRDYEALEVIGGVMWGNDGEYLPVHSVRVPDYFWKVIIRNNQTIAWIVPNTQEATKARLDDYLVSIAEIEQRTGHEVSVPENHKNEKESKS